LKLGGKREARRLIKEDLARERWEKGFFDMNSRILAEIPDDYLASLQGGIRPETAAYSALSMNGKDD
jgi:hypothetical protein